MLVSSLQSALTDGDSLCTHLHAWEFIPPALPAFAFGSVEQYADAPQHPRELPRRRPAPSSGLGGAVDPS